MNLRDRRILQRDGMYWRGDMPSFRAEPAQVPDDEPRTWGESWWFIGAATVIAVGCYVARAWGWL